MSTEALTVWESQPELPALTRVEERPDVVAMVEARSFVGQKPPRVFTRTGKILLKELRSDEEYCVALCFALRLGMSARLVASRFRISRASLAAVRHAMTERGELAPVRTRVDRLLDDMVEEGMEHVLDGIRTGKIHPGQLSIPVLAAYDKKAQRDAGIVVGTQRTVAAVTTEQLLAELAALEAIADSGSAAGPVIPVQTEAVPAVDTGVDTAPGPVPAPSGGADPAAAAAAAPGGGGGREAGRPSTTDGMPWKISEPKDTIS